MADQLLEIAKEHDQDLELKYNKFYIDDERVLSLIKELSPTATLGKGCARLKYSERAAMEILTDAIKEILYDTKPVGRIRRYWPSLCSLR